MYLKVDAPVAVVLDYEAETRRVCPSKIIWKNREYTVTKLGLHHHFRVGRTLHHIFSVICGEVFFRLNLDTDNLSWKLEEVGGEQIN